MEQRVEVDRSAFVHTGPGTLAGRYLRDHWQPVYESASLKSGCAVRIQLLGEKFTLYRDAFDTPHIVSDLCPHRRTALCTGRIEGETIRCFYHGWAFAPSGECIEQPAEPKPFCEKMRISSFPTREHLGLVFVYLGEGEAPALPVWHEFEHPDAVASIQMLPCNYFQSAENIMDDVHVGFAHGAFEELSGTNRGKTPPRVSAQETQFGLIGYFRGDDQEEKNVWIMPNICCVGYNLQIPMGTRLRRIRMRTLFWYVPIDDISHNHVMVTVPGVGLVAEHMRRQNRIPHSVADEIEKVLRGESRVHIDGTDSGREVPDLVRIQDGVAVVGQGPMYDRRTEQLGASDAAVVLLRKVWRRELRLVAESRPGSPFCRPDNLLQLVSPE